jgi:hypothetical protein
MRKYKIFYLNYPNSRKPTERKLIILRSLTKLEVDKLMTEYGSKTLHILFDMETNTDIREQQIKKLENKKFCELALMFIVNKPKGSVDDQIKLWLNNFYAGWVVQIIQNFLLLKKILIKH